MKPIKEELEVLEFYAKLTHTEDKYVWLREDKRGTYIEYAFKEGAPHDNRCLSWYYSLQPNAIIRNALAFGETEDDAQKEIEWRRKKIKEKIGQLFTLHSFTCGYEENLEYALENSKESWEKYNPGEPFVKEEHVCRVGCPSTKCVKNLTCSHWTYEEPVKCACWTLSEINGLPKSVSIPIDIALKLKDKLINYENN